MIEPASRPVALSIEQVEHYQEQGYVLLPGVFSASEATEFRREAHELMDRLMRNQDIDATWGSARMSVTEPHTKLLHCHNVQFQSAALTRLLVDPRLVDPVADLIGPNIQLHHNKLFIKPPEKGSPFPMHQDYPFFPHARDTMLAAIIHFDDAPLAKGCVQIVPGSHKHGPLEHDAEGSFHLPLEQWPLDLATPMEAKAGDVLIFSYLTVHGSGINASNEARTTLLVQMRAADDAPLNNAHHSRGQGMMLRGIDPAGKVRAGIDS
ncbi:MAG: phytanoyl-CoA dioxygenase family protein [Herpetosiphonaceae bacterium]|nr:phytanoyl-CoA dioxygenase family protein [Herpetosiphonaceae bacterium]